MMKVMVKWSTLLRWLWSCRRCPDTGGALRRNRTSSCDVFADADANRDCAIAHQNKLPVVQLIVEHALSRTHSLARERNWNCRRAFTL